MSSGVVLENSSKLPVRHPDYTYPPSRNPYWKKLKDLENRVFSDNETEAHAGSWRKQFPSEAVKKSRSSLLHVELGTNAGHVLLEWAAENPRDAFVGIDWKYKAIFRGVEKAVKRKIDNAIFFRAYAERLPYMFGPGEIDRLYLYFPDPWPKKAAWKNRYINEEALRAIAPLMSDQGIFHIKTDHPGYFEWMVEAIEKVRDTWSASELTRHLHADHPDPTSLQIPDVTLFEKLFIRDGIKINSVKLRPRR
jgi:tRNA (guanine-N7-)-methyltransferase